MRKRACLLFSASVLSLAAGAGAQPTARFADPTAPEASPAPSPTLPPEPPAALPRPIAAPPRAAPAPTGSWATRAAANLAARAQLREARGDSLGALRAYHDAIRMDPSYGSAYLHVARLREQLGDFAEAERVLSVAARLRPVAALAYEGRSRVRRRMGRDDAALADLETAVDRDPTSLDRNERLAQWYVERQAWPAALALWRRIADDLVRSEPQSERTRRARIQVQALGVLAAGSDPVLTGGAEHPSWVRRALANMARRGR